jgi:thioredoxin-related protein
MRRSAFAILVGLLIVSIVGVSLAQTAKKGQAEEDQSGLTWLKYDKALELGKEQNKHVIVYFTTSWCGYCKKMKQTTFKDPKVMELMNGNFVLAVVDGDSKNKLDVTDKEGKHIEMTEQELTRAFGVRGYPTFVFLKSDGTTIAPISGYLPADQFELALRFISTDSWEKMSFKEFAAQQKG